MKVAIVGPAFFGYLADIAKRMTARGIGTIYEDELPSNRVGAKVAIRQSPSMIKDRALARHLDQITRRILDEGCTHVLLVSVEAVTIEMVEALSAAGVVVCTYSFDSVENKPRVAELAPHVLRTASFDPVDCERHGFTMIPLFSAALVKDPAPERETDLFICTTLYANRPIVVRSLLRAAHADNLSFRAFLFSHSRVLWLLRNIREPRVWPLLAKIRTTPFSQLEIADATQRARVVLDLHHVKQTGLTMRTFEALSLGAVLLSSNPTALEELPAALASRVVQLDLKDLSGSIETALAVETTPLASELAYGLSVDRFIEQIVALMRGDAVPAAFAKVS